MFLKHLIRFGTEVYKLKCNGISGNLLQFLENYLFNRYQQVVLNGKQTKGKSIKENNSLKNMLIEMFLACLTKCMHLDYEDVIYR